ncbi:MAG: Ig-like domain-containing protein [Pirellula sp.]
MTVSPKRQAQQPISRNRVNKTARRTWMKRMLRLEALENRHLMAGDLPFQNPLAAKDVNGDFTISPLDALVVINRLNTEGTGSLANKPGPNDHSSYVDVDGDNSLSPLDALAVINALNTGEGVGELVEVRYKIFSVNADGTAGAELADSNPATPAPDAIVSTGQRLIIRTQMADLRPGTPRGVFSAYHDLSFTNADGSVDEKLLMQWGEFNQLDIQNNARLGTFTIRYGSETTTPISLAFNGNIYNAAGTVANIRNAIQALPSVGAGNVRVASLNSATSFRFGISFIGQLSRTNVVDPVIASNNFDTAGGAVAVTITGQASPDPSLDTVARVARNHNLDNGTFIDPGTGEVVPVTRYTNGPDGVLRTSNGTATRTVGLLGGFATSQTFLDPSVAASFLNIVDVLFVAGSAGVVNLNGNTSPLPLPGQSGDNLGIALYGAQAQYLDSSVVILPTGTITISDRLTAMSDSASIAEDSAQTTINVIANDVDRFGSSRGVVGVTQPAQGGSVSFVDGGANISFTPAANFFGTSIFTYTVRNNLNDSAVGTVTITITPVNDAPTVIATQFNVAEDPASPLVITPVQIFSPGPSNESGQTLTLSNATITSSPANGTVSIVAGNLNFSPAANFFGSVIVTVTGTDSTDSPSDPVRSAVATLTITVTPVNDAPVAFNGSLSVAEDGSLIVIGAGAPTNILTSSNPGPLESDALSLVSIQSPTTQGGTITTVSGVTTYRPAANFFGNDVFNYRISDGSLESEGTITVNVTPVNDAPTAVNDTGESARFVVLGISAPNPLDVMRNDSAGPLETNDTIRIVTITAPSIGTASIGNGGTRVIFTPPTGQFNITSTFSYTIEDSAGVRSSANVEVFIIPPVLPFALTDTVSIAEDTASTTIDVIANDFGNDGATKRLLSFTQPASGTGTASLDDRGTPGNPTDDRVNYAPPANFFGDAIFTYTMTDSVESSVPSTATVTVTVTPVNDAPTAVDRNASGVEDTTLTIAAANILNGLNKGPGEDAQTLTITDVANLTSNSGTVSIVNGDVQFVPSLNFFGQVLVRYTATDNGLNGTTPAPLSSSATITIDIAPVNDPPIGNADPQVVTAENQAVTFAISSLLANDTPGPANESSQTVSFVPLAGPVNTSNGGVVTQVGSNLVYTPAQSYNGLDTFSYQITDSQQTNATANVALTLRITEVNDAPSATTLTRNVFASVPTNFDLTQDLAGMSRGPANESSQTLRVSRVIPGSGTKGTVVLNPNGTITYTAPLGASGRDTFAYEIIDNGTTNGVADPLTARGTFNVDISPFIPSSIRGKVYIDDNNNGAIDPVELKIGGVEVTLATAATATTPAKTTTVMTLADGSYDFDLLPPGAYTVSYVTPSFTDDAPGPNSYIVNVVAPGDVNVVHNFAVLGVKASYANLLEYMSYTFDTNPRTRNAGIYAVVGADGTSEWTIARSSFETNSFHELVISDDGTKAYLTAVSGHDNSVQTAELNKRQFVVVTDATTGARLVRVLARSEDLVWHQVNLAAPPVEIRARGYLDTIDEVFAQQGW